MANVPNAATEEVLRQARNRDGLTEYVSVADLIHAVAHDRYAGEAG